MTTCHIRLQKDSSHCVFRAIFISPFLASSLEVTLLNTLYRSPQQIQFAFSNSFTDVTTIHGPAEERLSRPCHRSDPYPEVHL